MLTMLPAASAHARHVDMLMASFAVLAVLLTAPVVILTFAFAIRYRRGKAVDRRHAPDRNVWLEVSWSVVPFLLIFAFFILSAKIFFELHSDAADALPIDAVAKQWMWKFQHPGGQREINELHVPVGQPVTVTMASQDVIHSLYIPALRIKQDVVPGRYTTLSFTATEPGSYHLLCAQFCGTDHAVMGGRFIAMKPHDYALWLDQADHAPTPAAAGQELFRQLGCAACHEAGAAAPAPSLVGLYGRRIGLADGRSVIADDQYLHDAILDPNAAVTAGYRPIMPTYRKLIGEEDVARLVAYIRSKGDGR